MRVIALSLLGVLGAGSLVVSCDSPDGQRRVICDYAQDSGTFEGRLVTLDGPGVTFMIERVHPNVAATRSGRHIPPVGKPVVVHYDNGDEKFLHRGRRYKVQVWWIDESQSRLRFVSGVRVADRPCSGGTIYANGSAIDTAILTRSSTRHTFVVVAAGLISIGALAAGLALRKRRRQARNVRELRGSCS